jgi:hypothetical protein
MIIELMIKLFITTLYVIMAYDISYAVTHYAQYIAYQHIIILMTNFVILHNINLLII